MPVLRKFQSNSDPNTADGRPDIMLIVTSNEDGNEVQATTRPIEVKKKTAYVLVAVPLSS